MTTPNQHAGIDRPGIRSFCEPLWLPGWSERSVWGYDEQTGSYFAQLWRDEDADTDPTAWISGVDPVGSERQLATFIAEETDRDRETVLRAMLGELRKVESGGPPLCRLAAFPAE